MFFISPLTFISDYPPDIRTAYYRTQHKEADKKKPTMLMQIKKMWFFNYIEIPVLRTLLRKGDVHVYTKKGIQKLCDISGLKPELYEVRKGFRMHAW